MDATSPSTAATSSAGAADPDEALPVPLRELAALVATVAALTTAMDAAPEAAHALARELPELGAPGLTQLPEVGRVQDAEGLRLQLHRLHARLNPLLPTPAADLAPPPVTVPIVPDLPISLATRSSAIVEDELADAFVWWDDITEADIVRYRAVLDAADNERPLQRHLAANPHLLAQHLRGGHGRWVISQKRLGSEYVTDFVIGERDSGGPPGRSWSCRVPALACTCRRRTG